MKTKRFLAAILAVMMLASVVSMPASAHTYDRAVYIELQNGRDVENEGYGTLKKDDTSASYINYNKDMNGNNSLGPQYIEVIVYGSGNSTQNFTDCTRRTYNNLARTPAYIQKGREGLIRNDVREIYGATAFGQIYGRPHPNYSIAGNNIVTGKWSVDSIDYGYQYLNNIA